MSQKKNSLTLKKPTVKLAKKDSSFASMEEFLAVLDYKIKGLKKGEFVKGVVSEIRKNALFIDIGAKTEGVVLSKELARVRDFVSQLKVGDEITAQVRVPESERGQILLSIRKAAFEKAWQFFEEKFKSRENIKVLGKEVSSGGVVVIAPFGLFGFIPGSQIGVKYQHNPEKLIGLKITVKVLEVDREKNRLVFSERMASEPEIVDQEKEIMEKIKIGDVFRAEVVRVEPFGLFVKIKLPLKNKSVLQLEGLVHISEVSWDKVSDLLAMYKKGDKLKAMLISKEDGKLQFSLKRLFKDPWETIEEKYPKDTPIEGVVTQMTNFGALVKLEPGIEGLVHISKIPPQMVIREGEKIKCFVERIDKQNRRLSLELALMGKPLLYK